MSTVGNVGFIILIDVILLNVCAWRIYQQYTLPIITKYLIIEDFDVSLVHSFDTRPLVLGDVMVLLNASIVLISFKKYSVSIVLLHPVVFDHSIRSKAILGAYMNANVPTLLYLIHVYNRISTDGHYTNFALLELAQLYPGLAASLDLDSRTINIIDHASCYARFWIDTLEVHSYEGAVEHLGVGDVYTAIPLRHNVHSSLVKVRKPAVRDLSVCIDG